MSDETHTDTIGDAVAICARGEGLVMSARVEKLFAALAKARGKFGAISKTKTAEVKNKEGRFLYAYAYADLSDVLSAIEGPMAEAGLMYPQAPMPDGSLVTVIAHESGQWMANRIEPPFTAKDIQGLGGSITYLRRYALCAMLGIAAEEDDDGNRSMASQGRRAAAPAQRGGAAPAQPNAGPPGDFKRFCAELRKHELDYNKHVKPWAQRKNYGKPSSWTQDDRDILLDELAGKIEGKSSQKLIEEIKREAAAAAAEAAS